MLLQYGADINITNKYNQNAITCAFEKCENDKKIIKILLPNRKEFIANVNKLTTYTYKTLKISCFDFKIVHKNNFYFEVLFKFINGFHKIMSIM